MSKMIHSNFTNGSGTLKSAIKMQEEVFPFTERPSNKYYFFGDDVISGAARMNAFELFSLFTADIIKEKAIFVR